MNKTLLRAALGLAAALASVGPASAQVAGAGVAPAESRGALLYATHCVTCHTSQVHWRERKLATDWTSLQFQVRRWQGVMGLGWKQDDIEDVTRYLNERFYQHPQSMAPVSLR